MASWRASIVRDTVPNSTFLRLQDCSPLLKHGRELNDDGFLDDTLRSVSKDADISDIETSLEDAAKLNSKIPDVDIRRYCTIVLDSCASAIKNIGLYDLRYMRRILLHHLSMAEPVIREYCLKLLRAPMEGAEIRKGKIKDDEVKEIILVSEMFGEEVLPLLLPHLGGFVNNLP